MSRGPAVSGAVHNHHHHQTQGVASASAITPIMAPPIRTHAQNHDQTRVAERHAAVSGTEVSGMTPIAQKTVKLAEAPSNTTLVQKKKKMLPTYETPQDAPLESSPPFWAKSSA